MTKVNHTKVTQAFGQVAPGYARAVAVPHFRVNHGSNEFVKGCRHVNGIEPFGSHTKLKCLLPKCHILGDCIDSKRYPLFMARACSARVARVHVIHFGSQAMLISLHKNARTTPAVRAEIAASQESASILSWHSATVLPSKLCTSGRSASPLTIAPALHIACRLS